MDCSAWDPQFDGDRGPKELIRSVVGTRGINAFAAPFPRISGYPRPPAPSSVHLPQSSAVTYHRGDPSWWEEFT